MAKDSQYRLTQDQKNELRRLTQKANRRIKAYMKEYEKEGLTIIPFEESGGIQTKEQWATERTPISRSTKFGSEQAFKKHMAWLKQFDNPAKTQPVSEYTKAQRKKTIKAIETSIGNIAPREKQIVNEMSAADLSKFWDKFSERAKKLGIRYSSNAAMEGVLELYKEDRENLINKTL